MEVPELAVRQVGGDGQTQDRGAPETDVHLIDIGPILEYCREAGGDECECARQKPADGRDRALVVPLEDGVEMILLDLILVRCGQIDEVPDGEATFAELVAEPTLRR